MFKKNKARNSQQDEIENSTGNIENELSGNGPAANESPNLDSTTIMNIDSDVLDSEIDKDSTTVLQDSDIPGDLEEDENSYHGKHTAGAAGEKAMDSNETTVLPLSLDSDETVLFKSLSDSDKTMVFNKQNDPDETKVLSNEDATGFLPVNGPLDTNTRAATSTNPDDTSEFSYAELDPGKKTKKRKRSGKKKAGIIVGVIVGVLVVAYIAGSVFFMTHFEPGSTISGIDVSWKTAEEADQLLAAKASDYTLTIEERGDTSEEISGSDISMSYDSSQGQASEFLSSQNAFLFPQHLISKLTSSDSSDDYNATFTYDENALNSAINSLNCMDTENAVEPKDAYLEFNGTEYVVVAEEEGTVVLPETVKKIINEKVAQGASTVSLADENCYKEPEVTQDDPDFVKKAELYNKYIPFSLTYEFDDGTTYTLSGETLYSFLTVDEEAGTAEVNEDAITEWVSDFAAKYDTVGKTRKFTSVDGNTYTVSGGTYGWSIDEASEVAAIEAQFDSKESETRSPIWATTAATPLSTGTDPDWGDTYIELNLTEQHVYYVKDGEKVFEADVVTGLPDGEHETPSGVYYVLEKMQDKVLTGEIQTNGEPEYETPVAYWIRMTWTGVGFHDATWQPYYGGDLYKTNGSHGCINMSLSDAETLYGLVEVGCPIVSHY
ncbi:MAG: L,D-transpeptidase family protein [Coriobacteriales bacterium]|jgi:lipoprotein-anchoring transpeptidase ErfK/SrfK